MSSQSLPGSPVRRYPQAVLINVNAAKAGQPISNLPDAGPPRGKRLGVKDEHPQIKRHLRETYGAGRLARLSNRRASLGTNPDPSSPAPTPRHNPAGSTEAQMVFRITEVTVLNQCFQIRKLRCNQRRLKPFRRVPNGSASSISSRASRLTSARVICEPRSSSTISVPAFLPFARLLASIVKSTCSTTLTRSKSRQSIST